jgi:hypothetical protein
MGCENGPRDQKLVSRPNNRTAVQFSAILYIAPVYTVGWIQRVVDIEA